MLFTLYRENILNDINYSIALIVIVSSILFIVLYSLASIVIPFFYITKCINIGNGEKMDTKNSKVYIFIMTMTCYLILSIVLIVGYLVKGFNTFSIMGQAGTKLFLISTMIMISILIFMWLVTIFVKLQTHKKIKKYTDKTEESNRNIAETYGDMPKID